MLEIKLQVALKQAPEHDCDDLMKNQDYIEYEHSIYANSWSAKYELTAWHIVDDLNIYQLSLFSFFFF